MILFGGYSERLRQSFTDVWTLSLAGTPNWNVLAATGEPPSGFTPGMRPLMDRQRHRLLVFTDSSAVWQLPLNVPRWEHLHPEGQPPTQGGYGLVVLDPRRDKMVVIDPSLAALTNPGRQVTQTWTLSLGDRPRWSELITSGVNAPPLPDAVAYDPSRRVIVAVGRVDYDDPPRV